LNYRREIDGLRALAVVPVILFHAGYETFSGGFVGVDVFFVISGYLITAILLGEIESGEFSVVEFYERRARRILPALFLVVLVTMFLSTVVLFPQQLVSVAKSAISIPLFSSNFFFWSERGYFGDATELKPLIHTWSLAVEEQFYIVFPFLLLFLSKLHRRLAILTLAIAFVLSLAVSYYVTLLHFDTAFFFPFSRAWELLIGAFCAIFLRCKQYTFKRVSSEVAAAVGLAMIFGSYFLFDKNTLFPYVSALLPTIGTALFILTASDALLVRNLIGSKPLVWLGLISYSLYLWHQPVFALSRSIAIFESYWPALILLILALSLMSYFLVERPFRDGEKTSTRTIWAFAGAGSLGLIVFGAVIVGNNGFIGRFDPADQRILTQFATYSGYNQARFDSLIQAPFTKAESKKVVLIGDSFAKDFLNVVEESNLFGDYEFSTRQINSECGNLYLRSYDNVQSNIPAIRRERCQVLGRYDGEEFASLIEQADEIWLVSVWKEWIVDLLPESLANLQTDFGKPVIVVGLKDFGTINQEIALNVSPTERPAYTQKGGHHIRQMSKRLDRTLSNYEHYYPIMDGMCGGNHQECQVFTAEGAIISADGWHLTKEGAIEVSNRIRSKLLRLRNSGG
jgi:peptidoglycan/LPS O-acetylase OafA/YrhL